MLHIMCEAIFGRIIWIVMDIDALLLRDPSQQLLDGVVLAGQFCFELFQLGG